jgi:hypothetical protein
MVALLARQCSVRKCLLSRTQCRDVVSGTYCPGRLAPEQLHTFFNIHSANQTARPCKSES